LREEERRRIAPDNPLTDVLADGAWRGNSCFIIGGGPSLVGFDFNRLRGRGKIIVINKGFTAVPFADVLFFMDHMSFYRRLLTEKFGPESIKAWRAFAGIKAFLNLRGRATEGDIYSIRSLGRFGISPSLARGLFHGGNSGYGAINLALCLGAAPIYLLGYDMRYAPDGETHWHGGYNQGQPQRIYEGFRQRVDQLGDLINGRWPGRVINCNPRSALRNFPKVDLEKVLAE
jgi:hypothetical protein